MLERAISRRTSHRKTVLWEVAMLTLRPLTNAEQAAVYYERDDYYVDGQQVAPSSWWGEGARRLRLFGPVDRSSFRALLEGRLPDGTVLEGGTSRHRPGVDLTFSAPKSVSIAALIGGDARIIEAHEAAVTAALRYLQETAPRARNAIGGADRLEATTNLLIARFNHDTSRALDPQLHTHAVVLNVTRRSDGQWRALANEELFRSKMIGGAIYRAELARRLERLGYETVRTHADGRFEIGGIDEAQLAAFSRRRAQIVAHLEARGLDSPRAADAAARATRDKKQEIDRDVLRLEWRNQARQLGIDLGRMKGRVRRRPAGETRSLADRYLDRALARLTERNVVVSEKRLFEVALNLGIGRVTLEDIRRSLERKLADAELVLAAPVQRRDPFVRHFTTDEALANEQALLGLVERGRGQVAALATKRELDRTLNTIDTHGAHALSRGQAEAIALLLSTSDRIVGIQGYAGTGKTTGALLHIKRFTEEKGLEVRGFAPTAAAAEVLSRDAGVEAMTIARFLRSERTMKKKKRRKAELWIVDEASMLSNDTARALLDRAERAGARVLLVGDRDQLPSIEAGRAFGLLQDRGMPVAKIETIVRQKDPELARAVALTIGRDHEEALGAIGARVKELAVRNERLAALASDYAALHEKERDEALVVTPSNADRAALNRLIRTQLASMHALGEDHAAFILIPRDLTKDEKKDALHYREGDVVRFGRRYRRLDVEAGDRFTITRVEAAAGIVHLLDASGRTRTWRPERAAKVEIYEVARRAIAAGDRIRFTRNDRTLGRHNGELGRVITIDPARRTAEVLAGGRLHTLDLDREPHWEHAYASTIHAAQGRTTDRVFIHLDTTQAYLIGHESWYVALSRARNDVRIYTDDREKLPEVIRRALGQEAALDVVLKSKSELAQESKHEIAENTKLRQEPRRSEQRRVQASERPLEKLPRRAHEIERAAQERSDKPEGTREREKKKERQRGHGFGFGY